MRHESHFIVENSLDRPLVLNIEPEGAFFSLASGDEVAIFDDFDATPVTIRLESTEAGEQIVSIWPGDGNVRVEKDGINVLEILQQTGKARSA